MVARLRSPNRQRLYRVTPGGFTSVLDAQLSRMRLRERVEDFRDFCEFCTQAYRDQLM